VYINILFHCSNTKSLIASDDRRVQHVNRRQTACQTKGTGNLSHYWGQCTELDPEQYRHKTSKTTVLQGRNLNRQEVNILRGQQARIYLFESPPTGCSSKEQSTVVLFTYQSLPSVGNVLRLCRGSIEWSELYEPTIFLLNYWLYLSFLSLRCCNSVPINA